MKIREANNKDTENIVLLVKEGLFEQGFTYLPESSEADLQNIKAEYLDGGGTFLIIEDEKSNLIATGALKKLDKSIFKIRKMYVSKKYRRKGYGKKVLNQLIETAKAQGATQIILETSLVMKEAINLYKAYGFVETNLKPTSPRCDITMIKRL